MLKDEIANRLKNIRENMGYTQDSIAAYLGVTPQKISSFETGRTRIDVETLSVLCELYKVDANYILGVNRPDEDATELLEALSQRPELLVLLEKAVNSSKADVEKIAKITEIFQT